MSTISNSNGNNNNSSYTNQPVYQHNENIIFVHSQSPNIQYFTIGQKPYLKPSIAHPIIRERVAIVSNHSLTVTLESTQETGNILDLIVNYKLYQAPKAQYPNPVSLGTTELLKGVIDLTFSNLVENTKYILETQFYNPYYHDITGESSFPVQTSNLDTLDLSSIGEQDQDRDNSITITMYLDDHPEDISIQLEDNQLLGKEPITMVNLAKKPPNSEFKLTITNIPFGLYNLILLDKNGDGFEKDFTIEKYDDGKTTTNVFEGNIGFQKTIMMSVGKIRFKSQFAGSSLKNVSDLDEQKKRRARRGGGRGGFLSTTGSFTLSRNAGGNS